jgi:hypothetical protein
LSLQCSIFALAKSEHCQLTARPIGLMGLIATSLFGMRGFPPGRGPTTRLVHIFYLSYYSQDFIGWLEKQENKCL